MERLLSHNNLTTLTALWGDMSSIFSSDLMPSSGVTSV